MRALLLAFAFVAVGCGDSDPCAGATGACIALRVEGDVPMLDKLSITVDQPALKTLDTDPKPFSLPVQIALHLHDGVDPAASVNVEVVGSDGSGARAAGKTEAPIKLVDGRGKGTVTLVFGATGPDLGAPDLVGADLAGADLAGDDLAGADLSGADLTPVCGNHVKEPGEACDDGANGVNGDGCDDTCRFTGTLTLVSGRPGGPGHADDSSGPSARFYYPTGLASDGANLYVAGSDYSIRKLSGNLATPAVTTIAGKPFAFGSMDGTLATAMFSGPQDIDYIPGLSLFYVVDGGGSSIRQIDVAGNAVTTMTGSMGAIGALSGNVFGLGHSVNNLVFYDTGAGLRSFNGTTTSTVVALAGFQAAGVASAPTSCNDVVCNATYCYVACQSNIVKVDISNNTAANYAGKYNGSAWTSGCNDNATSTSATFTNITRLDIDVSGNLIALDAGCQTVRRINPSGVATIAGVAMTNGWQDGATSMSEFDSPMGLAHVGSTLYVADEHNHTIRSIGSTMVATIAGLAHDPNESSFSPTTPISNPNYASGFAGLTSDGTSVFAVDNQARFLRIAIASGAASTPSISLPVIGAPLNAIARIGSTLYVASNAQGFIASANLDGTNGQLVAGTPGMNSPPMDNPRLSAVIAPFKMTANATHLFWTEQSTLVRMLDLGSGMVSTLAGTTGTTDVQDATGTAAHFARASAIAADADYVYVADGVYIPPNGPPPTCIRRIEIATGIVMTIAGAPDQVGHLDETGTAARFSGIAGLATDGVSLFATEGGSAAVQDLAIGPTIRQIQLSDKVVTTMIGKPGQYGWRADVGVAARANFPGAIVYDAALGGLFLSDQGEYLLGRIQ